jgi:hypothetical protein
MNNTFIIGAGVSGLSAAHEISKYQPALVIDRLPVIGGTHSNYEDEFAIALKRDCDQNGVKFILGSTALRWSTEQQLLVVGPAGIEWMPGQHLVYAGGYRPSTQAELGILGDRLAGVLPYTLAHHFLETAVQLAKRVDILGNGNSARQVGKQLAHQGSHIIVLPMEQKDPRPEYAEDWWAGWKPLQVHGKGRVREIVVGKEDMVERILCDAVILAARMKPLRNIDGTIFDKESRNVTYVQPIDDTLTLEQRSANARQLASEYIAEVRRQNS